VWLNRSRGILRAPGRLRLKCDGTRSETKFRLSTKRTTPLKLAGASVQSTTCSRGVRISGSNAGYTMFWGSVKGTGYPLHSPVSPSLPLPCVTVCHHISTGLYEQRQVIADSGHSSRRMTVETSSDCFITVYFHLLSYNRRLSVSFKYNLAQYDLCSCINIRLYTKFVINFLH
jgi:hypothetical protein